MAKPLPRVEHLSDLDILNCYKYLTEAVLWGLSFVQRSELAPEDILIRAEQLGAAHGLTYTDMREVSRIPIGRLMNKSKYLMVGERI